LANGPRFPPQVPLQGSTVTSFSALCPRCWVFLAPTSRGRHVSPPLSGHFSVAARHIPSVEAVSPCFPSLSHYVFLTPFRPRLILVFCSLFVEVAPPGLPGPLLFPLFRVSLPLPGPRSLVPTSMYGAPLFFPPSTFHHRVLAWNPTGSFSLFDLIFPLLLPESTFTLFFNHRVRSPPPPPCDPYFFFSFRWTAVFSPPQLCDFLNVVHPFPCRSLTGSLGLLPSVKALPDDCFFIGRFKCRSLP